MSVEDKMVLDSGGTIVDRLCSWSLCVRKEEGISPNVSASACMWAAL